MRFDRHGSSRGLLDAHSHDVALERAVTSAKVPAGAIPRRRRCDVSALIMDNCANPKTLPECLRVLGNRDFGLPVNELAACRLQIFGKPLDLNPLWLLVNV